MAHPEKTFRIGGCSASVFLNTVNRSEWDGPRSFRSVVLQRRYLDGNEWRTSTSFTLADMPAAISVMKMALNYVADQEAASSVVQQGVD